MATSIVLGGFLLVITLSGVLGGKWCYEYGDNIFDDDDMMYCTSGCCGDMYNRYCCIDGNVGMIVGIVIGSLVGVGVIITIIVIICCCKRRPGRSGMVFGGTQPAATVVTTGNNQQMTTVATHQMTPGVYPYGQGQVTTGYTAYSQTPVAGGYTAPPPQDQAKFQPPPSYEQVS